MAYAGQIITHPSLGLTIRFLKTHLETAGLGWEAEYTIETGRHKRMLPHTHIHSDEWFQVLQGECRFRLNGKTYKARRGSEIYLPAGQSHTHPWNIGKQALVMRNIMLLNAPNQTDHGEIKRIEEYLEHWFHLACRGQVKKDGNPYLLQSAVFFEALKKQLVFGSFPPLLQDIVLKPLSIVGKWKGYRRTYYE